MRKNHYNMRRHIPVNAYESIADSYNNVPTTEHTLIARIKCRKCMKPQACASALNPNHA